jgi:CHAD domain-containing protein
LVESGADQGPRRIGAPLRAAPAPGGEGRPKVRALRLAVVKPRPPRPSAPSVDHVQARLREQLEAVRAHDPGTRLGTDPEALHQMRVAVRRSRAILRAARPMFEAGAVQALREELAWLGTVLGPVRDLDVLREYLEAELATLPPPERRAGRRILGLLGETRARARRELLEQLDDRRYVAVLARLADFVDAPPVTDADVSLRDLAAREFKKLRKMADRLPKAPDDAELHRLRIKTKRARYVAELAVPVVGRLAARFAKRARKLQDVLGEHRDAVLAESRLRELSEVARGRRAAFVLGRLAERQRARRLGTRAAIERHWRKLERRGRKAWK